MKASRVLIIKFNPRLRLGLSSRLALGTILLLTLLMAIDGWLDVRREQTLFWDELSQRSFLLADALEDVLADPLYKGDIAAADDITKLIARNSDIGYIQVFGIGGRLLADTRVSDYPTGRKSDDYILRAVAGQRTTLHRTDEQELVVATPITVGREVVGIASVSFGTHSIQEKTASIIFQHLWQGILLIVVGTILSVLVGQHIIRPVRRLAQAAKKVGQGGFAEPTHGHRGDEIWQTRRLRPECKYFP